MKKTKERQARTGTKPNVSSSGGPGEILCQYGYELKGNEYWHKENDNDFRIKIGNRNVTFKSKKGTQTFYVKGGTDKLVFDDLSRMIQSSMV